MLPVQHHSWSPQDLTQKDPENVKADHSEPWTRPNLSNKKPGLEGMQTLKECQQLITELAKEVEDISKHARKRDMMGKERGTLGKPVASQSLEGSRTLILQWAKELKGLEHLRERTRQTEVTQRVRKNEGWGGRCPEKDRQRIMDWAMELQTASEICGLSDTDLKQVLSNHDVKETKLTSVLPFLEFVAWSLLSHDTEEDITKIWLSTKQRAWKAGSPKYIPNSVWQWIHSASVNVCLDPKTSHPWLDISQDNQHVKEGNSGRTVQDFPQRFDQLSCVLGSQGFTTGRYYWEVEVSPRGSWRLGVTTASAPRKGRFQMSPAKGYWNLWRGSQNLWASTDPQTKLLETITPHLVGVYLDYLEGQVSFYDAESRSHIYTFSDTFTERVFPVFGCLDGDTVLKIKTCAVE